MTRRPSMSVPVGEVVASTNSAGAVTCTDSVTEPSSSVASARVVWMTSTRTAESTSRLNPGDSMRTW